MNTFTMGIGTQSTHDGKPGAPGKTHMIGIGEQKIAQAPDKVTTLGLGSCVGLVLYDPIVKVGGMVHIMLPAAPKDAPGFNPYKFADTAIAEMLRLMLTRGAMRPRLVAKMAGGAHMFNTSVNIDIMNVGERNVQTCKRILNDLSIRLIAEDTGSTSGRSIEFCCETGHLQVRTVSPKNIRLI